MTAGNFGAMVAAMLLLSGAAQADELHMGIHREVNPHLVQASPHSETLYLARTASGCHVILSEWQGDFVDPRHSDDEIEGLTLDWTGACDPQGYATGKGHLVLKAEMSSRNRGYAWSFTADSSVTMKSGVPTGPSSLTRHWSRDVTGKPLTVTDDQYMSNGCIGDRSPYPQKCPFDAIAWRAQLGPQTEERQTALGSGPSPDATVPMGGRVTAIATPSAAAGRGPFLNSCLSLKAPEGDREPGRWGANVWTIQNSCQIKLYVTWCADVDSRSSLIAQKRLHEQAGRHE